MNLNAAYIIAWWVCLHRWAWNSLTD